MEQATLRLDGWGERLTCFTAALGTWLADRCQPWWGPLLAHGPTLIVSRADDHHFMFEHAPHPWMPSFGLSFTGSDDWEAVSAALRAQSARDGSVIVAADVYSLPWHRGHLRWHAPHWLVVRGHADSAYLEDALDMNTPQGVQNARLVRVAWDDLREIARALDPVSEVFHLRERSIAGAADLEVAARYRWLRRVAPIAPGTAYGSLRGAAACRGLAEYFDAAGARQQAYAQADDLWQAVRQRELAVAAAELESLPIGNEGKLHWRAALAEWRRIPPLLLHAKLRAQGGAVDPARHLSAALRRVAEYEDRFLFGPQSFEKLPQGAPAQREVELHA